MTEEVVGYTLSVGGQYHPDRVEVTLLGGKVVYRGEYLYVRHPQDDGKAVFLQAEDVYLKRPTSSYDEKLVKDGIVREDEERLVGKAVCWQVGYEDDSGSIRPVLVPIPPMTPVYRPRPGELESFINPRGPSISVGTIYPTDVRLRLDLKMLFRQGALIVGGVGTGKSTLLLSMMLRMLSSIKPVHLLVMDWDGEFNAPLLREYAERAGGYARITAATRLKKVEKPLSPHEWYNRFRALSGLAPQDRLMRALYSVVKKYEEQGERALEWSRKAFEEKILPRVEKPELRQGLTEAAEKVFSELEAPEEEEAVDVVQLVRENALVHVDFTDAENWDEIIHKTKEILEGCYVEARRNPEFGVAVFIDEVHNFAPQSPHEGAASREAYNEMIPLMKLLATTGPRNGVPLFIATQRLSEVDKFVSTQMGQNIFAFRVEDVDLERLRGIMGSDIAYAARLLPRGQCIYKGHALKINRPVITVVEKIADVASVGRDLMTRWGAKSIS